LRADDGERGRVFALILAARKVKIAAIAMTAKPNKNPCLFFMEFSLRP
jgi:hypothetical protein